MQETESRIAPWQAYILVAIPFIATIAVTGLNFRVIGDEYFYLPIIQRFASQWPTPDIRDYSAGSTPLALLILTAFGKIVGFEIWKLRLLTAISNFAAICVFYRLATRSRLPYPLVSTFLFLCFPYIFFHGFTIYIESIPLLFGLLALWYFLEENPVEVSVFKGSLFALLAVYCRQTYLVFPTGMILYEIWSHRSGITMRCVRRIALLSIPFVALVPIFLLWDGLNPPIYRNLFSLHASFNRPNYVAICVGVYFAPFILESFKAGWRWLLIGPALLPAYFLAVPTIARGYSAADQQAAITGLTIRALESVRQRIGHWAGDGLQLLLWLAGTLILIGELANGKWDTFKVKLIVMLGVFTGLITITPATTERYLIPAMPLLILLLHRRLERRWVLVLWMVLLMLLSVAFAVWQIKFKSFEAWGA